MGIKFWIDIIVILLIVSLFFLNKDKSKQIKRLISNHESEKEKLNIEISILKHKISTYENRETGIAQREKLSEKAIESRKNQLKIEEQAIEDKRKSFACERHALDLELDKNRRLFEQEMQEIREDQNLKIAQKINELRDREQILESIAIIIFTTSHLLCPFNWT